MKPTKIGKMTDKELIEQVKEYRRVLHESWCRNDIIYLVQQARQQGIAEGRAEQDKRRDIPNKNRQSMAIYRSEKQAYAKGFKDGTAKYYSRDYAKGVADGQSDLKTRLMSKELIEKMCEIWYVDIYYKNHKEDIFKKGRRDGMKCFIEKALAEATKGEKVF
jgi:phosphoribosyl-AMP cyclohydrolase